MLAAPAASLITDDRPSSLPHQQGRALCLVSHMLLRPLLCVYLDLQPACPHTTPRYTSTILACDTQPSRTVLVCRSYWTQSRAWAHKPALKRHSLTRSSTKNALQPRTSGTSASPSAAVHQQHTTTLTPSQQYPGGKHTRWPYPRHLALLPLRSSHQNTPSTSSSPSVVARPHSHFVSQPQAQGSCTLPAVVGGAHSAHRQTLPQPQARAQGSCTLPAVAR